MRTTDITYSTSTYYGEAELLHRWAIEDEQGIASEMYVTMDTLTVVNVETRRDRQGEGLARSLWETASEAFDIMHDLPAHRTAEGDAFAEAVGGESATECHVSTCFCTDDIWTPEY